MDGSKEYNVCAKWKNKFWCATAVGAGNKHTSWAYCLKDVCPLEGETIALSTTVPTTTISTTTITSSETTSCKTTKGTDCVFPFISDGKEYNVCAKWKKSYWCATKVGEDNVYTAWAYCDLKSCPLEGETPSLTSTQTTTTATTTIEIETSTEVPVFITDRKTLSVLDNSLHLVERNDDDAQRWIFQDMAFKNIESGNYLGMSSEGQISMVTSHERNQWSFQDGLLVHLDSGLVLTVTNSSRVSLKARLDNTIISRRTNPTSNQRSKRMNVDSIIEKIQNLQKGMAVSSAVDQVWKLATEGPVRCEELGSQLEDLSRGEIFSHFKADTECLEGVLPILTVYTEKNKIGCKLTSGDSNDKENYFSKVSHCAQEVQEKEKIFLLVHGFMPSLGDDTSGFLQTLVNMKNVLLQKYDSSNIAVVIVDWTKGSKIDLKGLAYDSLKGAASGLISSANVAGSVKGILTGAVKNLAELGPYHQAAANTRYTGAAIARVLQQIHKINTEAEYHCIGHSLGAHTCGFAGKALKKIENNLMLSRLSAMDPAGPLFLKKILLAGSSDNPKDARVDKGDAVFVDATHTDGRIYGAFTPVGHIDFYPGNAGEYGYAQPPFDWVDDIQGESHSRAISLYTATIENRYTLNRRSICNFQSND